MEAMQKDQPRALLTRILMVCFGPFNATSIRRHAYLVSGDFTKLLLLLVVLLLASRVAQAPSGADLAVGIAIDISLVGLVVVLTRVWSHSLAPPDAARFRAGALMLFVGCTYAAAVIGIFMSAAPGVAMVLFAGLWVSFRVRLLNPSRKVDSSEK